MKGVLDNSFHLIEVDYEDLEFGTTVVFDEDEVATFKCGEEVEILKTIHDDSFVGGIAYVILNRNNDSITVSAVVVNLID